MGRMPDHRRKEPIRDATQASRQVAVAPVKRPTEPCEKESRRIREIRVGVRELRERGRGDAA